MHAHTHTNTHTRTHTGVPLQRGHQCGVRRPAGPDERGRLAADAADADDAAPLDDPDELVLDFSGPSWMEITDARGEQLLYGLVQEEGEQTLQGEAPFSVVIGDVTQVNVYYEDSAVDLGPEDAGRVVRIQVP